MNPPTRFSAQEYNTPESQLPAAANAVLPFGNLVARNADNHAVLAADTAGLTIVGVAFGVANFFSNDQTVDNTGRAAGTNKVRLKTGVFRFNNSATAPVTAAEIGQPVFVEDQTTIAKTTAHRVAAGIAIGLDSTQNDVDHHVWVFIGPAGTLPGSPSLDDTPPVS